MKWERKLASLILAGCLALSSVPALATEADVTGDAGDIVSKETALQSEQELKAAGVAAKSYYCTKRTMYNSDGSKYSEATYDEQGNATTYALYNEDGDVWCRYEYEYDADGNDTLYKRYVDDSIDDWITYEYDADGKLIKDTRCNSDGSASIWFVYEYNANGNEIKVTEYESDGTSYVYSQSEYDANGSITKYTEYNDDGSVDEDSSYQAKSEYDANGNVTKCTRYDNDGAVNDWNVYEYDANGNLTKDSYYNSSGVLRSCYEYAYDEDGKLTKYAHADYEDDGSLNFQTTYEYDADGNEIAYTYKDGRGGSLWSEYEYDANGNGTKETVYSAGGVSYWYVNEYAKLSANPFSDVSTGTWYTDAVLWAVNKGITNGTTDTTFSPDDGCTRGQIVTFLWRAAGCPEPTSTENPFTDIDANAYYYKAVLWAVSKGITNGTTSTTFSPDATCKRSEAVTFIWRANGKPTVSTSNPFTDVPSGEWYTDAVLWAVNKGITTGMTTTTFEPATTCKRSHIVTFLYRAA